MTQRIVHELVGYHPATDEWIWSVELLRDGLETIKRMIETDEDDPDAIGSYPVDFAIATDIAGLVGAGPLDPALVYYMEPYAEASAPA
ncbi:DUF7683 domain-containing protein [Salinarimonas chemoclinalis]|uniref:DUF7683 domain-containing protein n=1 Tax=Salinarimonas chemoclinalis TaxID=3241599 RepID=UPI0035576F67